MRGGWGYDNALTETVSVSETVQACEFEGWGPGAVWDCHAECALLLSAITDHLRVSVYGS